MEETNLKPAPAVADLSYKGSIDYTIEFTANNVGVRILNPGPISTAAIFSMAADHFQRLVQSNRDNPEGAKKKFTAHERQCIKSAEWIITRIANAQLGAAYAEIKNQPLKDVKA